MLAASGLVLDMYDFEMRDVYVPENWMEDGGIQPKSLSRTYSLLSDAASWIGT